MRLTSYFDIKYLTGIYTDNLSNAKAKGIDKLNSIADVKSVSRIIKNKVLSNTYHFTPYLEILKLKGRNKIPRVISIPTIRDRIVLISLKELLHDAFPECINNKLPNKYIREIKEYLSTPDVHFLKLDIKHFYDTINRELLLEKLAKKIKNKAIIDLIEKAISTPSVPNHTSTSAYNKYKTMEGIPQGLSISNILAQIYLYNFDQLINKRKYFYRRYVDDILVLNEGEISNYKYVNLQKALANIHLKVNDEKYAQGHISQGFTFLSYKIKENGISIADNNIQIFLRRIAGKFTWFKNGYRDKNKRPEWITTDRRFKEVFMEELNESITGIISLNRNYGWLFYFSEMDDKALLFKLDKIIQSFFIKMKEFEHKVPPNLKKLTRAYYVIKFDKNKNYISNYDVYNTFRQKRNFLVFRGWINPSIQYPDKAIETLFNKYIARQIKYVEQDIGYGYF